MTGKLWKDALVMYDRETGSLWSHVSGRAIKGALEGSVLERIPLVHTTWREWKALHPETLVLDKEGEPAHDTAYASYHRSRSRLGIFGTRNLDPSLQGKSRVLGTWVGQAAMAFPLEDLAEESLAQVELGGLPLVVAYNRRGEGGAVFSRRVEDRTLTFEGLTEHDGLLYMTDRETGSTWVALSGEAVAGPLKGTRLEQQSATQAFWFAWRNFFPTTRVWRGGDAGGG